jgi:hypothetical protein
MIAPKESPMLESRLEASLSRCWAWSSKPVVRHFVSRVGSTPTSFRQQLIDNRWSHPDGSKKLGLRQQTAYRNGRSMPTSYGEAPRLPESRSRRTESTLRYTQ